MVSLRALPSPHNREDQPMTDTKTLNTLDFSQERFAVQALRDEGFVLMSDNINVWRSADGIIDAVIKQRFRDGRFYIVLFA